GVIPHAHFGCVTIGMVILDIRCGRRDDYRWRVRGNCCPTLYHQYLRYGGPKPADNAPTDFYCQLGIVAAYYRRYRVVIGYQPTLYVHPTQPPRPIETPRPCGARG